jgi:hypothetical protein
MARSIVRPSKRAVDPSRNRKATEEEFHKALAEVDSLLVAIDPLDMLHAADFIRTMDPPLSAEAITLIARRAIRLAESHRQRNAGGQPRNRDLLTLELRKILRAKPCAGADDVIEALRERAELDVSEDGTVSWYDGTDHHHGVTRANIGKRISRLRKKYR